MATPLCQVAMSVSDLPRTHAWYRAALGFRPASGTNTFKGFLAENVQGVPGAASTCWWLVDDRDFLQLELFQLHRPETRPLPQDWRACDIGYSTLGLLVHDLDQTLARMAALGTRPLSPPMGEPGQRRVCVRDPEGVLLELYECDPLTGTANLSADSPVRTLSVTLSVVDLEQSRTFFCDLLGLEPLPEAQLHQPGHEALWGLSGASTRRLLLRAGPCLVELVQYLEPVGKPLAQDYRISDQGLLNIALGFRSRADFNAVYRRCRNAGIRGNWRPLDMGAWKVVYVNDRQRFSVELLQVQPWYLGRMGFLPKKHAPNLAVAGRRSVTISCAIDRPAQQVWPVLADHQGMSAWCPASKVILAAQGSDEGRGAGSVRTLCLPGMAVEQEITAWFPGAGYDYHTRRGAPLRNHRGFVRLLPGEQGCTVQWRIDFRPLIPLTGGITQRLLQLLLTHILTRLKRTVESSAQHCASR